MARDLSVMRAVGVVGRFTALSRIFGLLRDQLMAHHFGSGLAISAFYVAFRIPNLFRGLFGEGALSSAFVPVFTEKLEHESKDSAAMLAGRMLGLLTAVLGTLTAALWIGALLLESRVAPEGRWAAVLPLLRIMLPYALLICLAALLMGMLNTVRHYAVPAFAPVLLNLVWIGALFVSRPLAGDDSAARMRVLAWGVLLAGVLQMGIQIPVLWRAGLRTRLRFDFLRHRDVARIMQRMAPAALGMGVVQINALLDSVLALIAADWAPASLFFADRLVYLPLGVFATALGTVLLPTYSRQIARSDDAGFRDTLRYALLNVLGIMTPAATLMLVLAEPTVALTFSWQGGKFGPVEVARTARALACYAPGLLVFSLYKAIVPAYYANKDMRTPMRIALWCVLFNLLMNLAAVLTLPVEWRHAGLAFSSVLSSTINVAMLLRGLSRRSPTLDWRGLRQALERTLCVATAMGLIVMPVAAIIRASIDPALWGGKAVQLLPLAAGGVLGIALYAFGIRWLCPTVWSVLRELWTRRAP